MTPAERAVMEALMQGPAVPQFADGDPRNKPVTMGKAVTPPARVSTIGKLVNSLPGVTDRLDLLNDWFNPVEALRQSGEASQEMFAPGKHPWERVGSFGKMVSGMASTVAPMIAASRGAMPAADAVVDGMTGFSAMPKAMGAEFALDEFGGLKLYHGTTDEGYEGIMDSGFNGRSYFSPSRSTAEDYASNVGGSRDSVIEAIIPEDAALIDLDLPGGRLLTPAEAAEYLGSDDLKSATDFYNRGYSIGVEDPSLVSIVKNGVEVPLGSAVSPPGITAYHGSPHSFDKFSSSKIGTGEGAQAYGHGLYFAENEGVAKGYRDALADGVERFFVDGQEVLSRNLRGVPLDVSDPKTAAIVYAAREGRTKAARYFKTQGEWGQKAMAELNAMKGSLIEAQTPGSMYEVRINANPDDFLDWDKPLSEQPAWSKVKADWDATLGDPDIIMERLGINENVATGRQYLDSIAPQGAGEAFRGVSARLKDQGVAGIKYLDAGSRGAGDGSRNYVVFDENLIEIVRKYGIAGAAAMLGVSAADVEEAMAGQ